MGVTLVFLAVGSLLWVIYYGVFTVYLYLGVFTMWLLRVFTVGSLP